MKEFFSKENLVTFAMVTLAVVVAVVFVIPIVRKFVPSTKAATTTTTAAPTS